MFEYLFALVGLYVGWSLVCLELNYRRASAMGIPLIRVPIDPLNVVFMVLEPHIFKLIDRLPLHVLPTFIKYMRRGWFFLDKADSHIKYGPMWAYITPRSIHIQICDPEAVNDMFNRRWDFIRPIENYKLLEVYGPCISTAGSYEWSRHRKVLAAPFNESIMGFVWNESLDQARQMIRSWTSSTSAIESYAKDLRTLSLNVLAATGFRRSFSFKPVSDKGSEIDVAASYRDALSTVLDNVIFLMLVPYRYLSFPWLPQSLQKIGNAGTEFRKHMERMLEEETEALARGEEGAGSLMTSFVKSMTVPENGSTKPSKGLSVDEIYGNIFVINFAGHDTTANTLAFTMALLATQPEIQDWVAEEVRDVVAYQSDDWEYSNLYPRLLRCRAVLYETLRLFPPIMTLPKHTSSSPQGLNVGGRIIIVPAHTSTSPSLLAIHTHPKYWPDPLTWKPSRWMAKENRRDCLVTPAKGTYFPWSDGPQNCPGRKFSEVEFVAVLALVMRDHVLKIVKETDESEKVARERARGIVSDCDMQILLRMRNADRLKLECERRGAGAKALAPVDRQA